MNKKWILISAIAVLCLLPLFGIASAEETEAGNGGTFKLPASLLVIEDEAFAGTAAQTVILPEGLESIGAGAFEDVPTLKDVYIPNTTTYIADSALTVTPDLTIHGIDNSYAKDWAHEHEIPFVVDDIWTKVVQSGWVPTVRVERTNLYIATIVLIILFEFFRLGYYEVRSRRPQDRPDLYPIEYRFP